jgi:glycosyltransferase involved in cell wall biosynthesis
MKTILYHSNNSKAFTGFGKHCKNILKYLQRTGKYNIIEFANGSPWSAPQNKMKPWKCVGSLPDDKSELHRLNTDPQRARAAGYGAEMVDKAISEFKPDIYIGVEDIWAFANYWDKPWWNKINHMIWTTLDSQPILPQALEAAPKTKNFFTWASFAERDMAKIGHDHVKTLHGSVNTEDFYKLSDIQRYQLREKYGLLDSYVIGFVFRNQLRKSVPNILDGFKLFKKDCPKAKLLLHTHWSEGWDIM